MRIFALSDIHVDYDLNAQWIANLSASDYRDDVLILAGDVSDSVERLRTSLRTLASKFRQLLYVPGNHDLWVRDQPGRSSLDKFRQLCALVADSGASMRTFHHGTLSIVPLLGWYDYSFGQPSEELLERWMDFRACRWPDSMQARDVAEHFSELNSSTLDVSNDTIISFSHFLPRIDLMPHFIPHEKRFLYPILGSELLEEQVRRLKPRLHVYGHSHVNRQVTLDGISYINNALGYPHETRIAARKLLCIHEH
jgi:predicted phosphodiesterase